MQYKDYTAIIEYDDRASTFHGRVAGIGTPIPFDGVSVDALRSAFRAAVDEYLSQCAADGRQPERLYRGCFNVRIDPELHRDAVVLACEQNITLNAFVERAIAHSVRRHRRKSPPTDAENL